LIRILASILDKNILCCSGCYFSSIIEYKGDASILMNNRPFDHDCPNGIIPGIAFFITKEARLYGRCTLLVIPKSFSFVHIIYPSKARSQVAFPHWGRQI